MAEGQDVKPCDLGNPARPEAGIGPLQRQPCDGKGATGLMSRGIYCLCMGYHKREKCRTEPVHLSRAPASTEKYLKMIYRKKMCFKSVAGMLLFLTCKSFQAPCAT